MLCAWLQGDRRPDCGALDAECDPSGKAGSDHVHTVSQGEDASGCESHREDEAAEWDDDVSV